MTSTNYLEDPDYYLKRSRSLLASDYPLEIMTIGENSSELDLVRWHWHEEIEFQYIKKGQAYVTCDESNLLVSQGDIIFINQNVRHFITPTASDADDYFFASIIVNPVFITGFGQLDMEKKYLSPVLYDTSLKYLHLTPKDAGYQRFLQEILQILQYNQEKRPCYELLTKASLLCLWKELYDRSSAAIQPVPTKTAVLDEQRVKQAILYIQEHYMEAIALDDIAGSIMVSKSECCRCFKRAMNTTPFEYLMKYRIMESTKRMHRRTQESISEIAGSVGFNNTSYYNKIFKKFMDCTPTQYRSSIKKDLPTLS